MLSVLRQRQPGLTIVLEGIHDPHNVSAILRSADGVGIREIQLVYTLEKFPRLGKKSSASATKWISRRKFPSIQACYDQLRLEGFHIYATRIGPGSASLYELDLVQNVALVFGNEHRGVSDEAAAGADGLMQIPMMGMIQSLNVSVACAVSLYEACRQRVAAGRYEKSSLPSNALENMFEEWKKKR